MRVYWLIAALAAVSLGASGSSLAQTAPQGKKVASTETPQAAAAFTPSGLMRLCRLYFGGVKYRGSVKTAKYDGVPQDRVYSFGVREEVSLDTSSGLCKVVYSWYRVDNRDWSSVFVGYFDGWRLVYTDSKVERVYTHYTPEGERFLNVEGTFMMDKTGSKLHHGTARLQRIAP